MSFFNYAGIHEAGTFEVPQVVGARARPLR